MTDPIMLSPADLWQMIVAICGAIITLSGAGAVIANIIHKAKVALFVKYAEVAGMEPAVEHSVIDIMIGRYNRDLVFSHFCSVT